MEEKRKFKRVPFQASVSFSLEDGTKIVSECRNVSMLGVFLQSDRAIPLNTPGKLILTLECGADKLMIFADARVVRHVPADDSGQEAGIGLEFVDLDPDSSITLYNVIRYQTGDDAFALAPDSAALPRPD